MTLIVALRNFANSPKKEKIANGVPCAVVHILLRRSSPFTTPQTSCHSPVRKEWPSHRRFPRNSTPVEMLKSSNSVNKCHTQDHKLTSDSQCVRRHFAYFHDSRNCSTAPSAVHTGVLISPWLDLFPDVFCLMVRIFRLMLVLFYIYIYTIYMYIPPIVIINRIFFSLGAIAL